MTDKTLNRFDVNVDKSHLFYIVTGKSAKEETTTFLLSICQAGSKMRQKFTEERRKEPKRFEERIDRRKLYTFQTECGRKKISNKGGKVVAAFMVRDIFGSVLRLFLENSIDIAEVLRHPLISVPSSLSHVDWNMLKSPASALMIHLESKVKSAPPASINITIIDAMLFKQLQVNLPDTFGEIAKYLLKSPMNHDYQEIHFVIDKWVSPSIKDCECDQRGSSSMTYRISRVGQKRPGNWLQALRNSSFKKSLIEFLVKVWSDDSLERSFVFE